MVKKGRAYIAAGTGGVQVLRVKTGEWIGELPAPIVPGLDATETVTNAVAVDDDLIFVSNGEAGVYVWRRPDDDDDDSDGGGGGNPVTFELVGKLQFGVDESVNHVEFKGKYLILASGLGGLKVVRVNK